MFRRALVAGTLALLAVATVTAAAARESEDYTVDGRDVFTVGNGHVHSETVYHGIQQLSIRHDGRSTIYVAHVEYEKRGDGGTQHERASYTTTLLPSGEQRDGPSRDPDYLTVLNQPFSVQLDTPTMRDLAHVKRPVPFEFPSPMTGAPLQGTLRRLPDGTIDGARVMGIAFAAAGPLHGALPDRPGLALAGSITMKGTAYYAYGSALLFALDATLSIAGTLDDAAQKAPVSIVYARSIRVAPDRRAAGRSPSRSPSSGPARS